MHHSEPLWLKRASKVSYTRTPQERIWGAGEISLTHLHLLSISVFHNHDEAAFPFAGRVPHMHCV